jgi:recombination protein RecT
MGNNLPVEKIVNQVAPTFEDMAKVHSAVSWRQEASFAMQALSNNSYLASVAVKNPESLQQAIINVAAVGLSLSPVFARAYLVPRDGKICLDISYRGYIHLALETGALDWVQADMVHVKDHFVVKGQGQKPEHQYQPFGDRGEVIGCYAIAKTNQGDFLTTTMTVEDINAIRDRSAGWRAHKKSGSSTPWLTDYSEMAKKTVIKRAYKTWPMVSTNPRLSQAIDLSNETEGINFNEEPQTDNTEALQVEIRSHLERIGRTEERFLGHFETMIKREIKSMDELTVPELEQAIVFLMDLPSAQKKGAS